MNKNLIICYGGKSTEKDVSIITALQIYKRFKAKNYDIKLVYIDPIGDWYIGEKLAEFKNYAGTINCSKLQKVGLKPNDNYLYKIKNNKFKPLFKIDFALNCCHGGDGESGKLTALFQMCGIATSTGSCASMEIMMDKFLTKQLLIANELPTVDFFAIEKKDWLHNRDKVITQLTQFGLPVVCKPCSQGSSVGVCLIEWFADFETAVNLCFDFGQRVIVERAIVNKREFNVAVKTQNGEIVTSLIEEPIAKSTVISFEDKYLSGSTKIKGVSKLGKFSVAGGMETSERKFPADINKKLERKITYIAKSFYKLINANSVVRIDFLYDKDSGALYFGEANAIPGSLGYYFFDREDFLENIITESVEYWRKIFMAKFTTPVAKIF